MRKVWLILCCLTLAVLLTACAGTKDFFSNQDPFGKTTSVVTEQKEESESTDAPETSSDGTEGTEDADTGDTSAGDTASTDGTDEEDTTVTHPANDTSDTGNTENTGNTAAGDPRCETCGAALRKDSAHSALCSHYAVLPTQSAAHDLLVGLEGMKEDLVVTVLDGESEDWSFVLNYMDRDAYDCLIAAISPTIYAEVTATEEHYRAQKTFGAKHFTFVVNITVGDTRRAEIHLTGYAA